MDLNDQVKESLENPETCVTENDSTDLSSKDANPEFNELKNDLSPPKIEEITVKRAISPIKWDDDETPTSEKSLKKVSNRDKFVAAKTSSIFDNACYFLVKSINFENIEIAIEKNIWSTSRANEGRLARAFKNYSNVILIFSVCESSAFQGFARMSSLPDRDIRVRWVLSGIMRQSNLSYPFKIEWIHRKDLSFAATVNLINSWNENKPVKIGRDGQEIEPNCGRSLCELFDSEAAGDLNVLLENRRRSKDEVVLRKQIPEKNDRNFEKKDRFDNNRRRDFRNYSQNSRDFRNDNLDGYKAAIQYNAAQSFNPVLSNSAQQIWATKLATMASLSHGGMVPAAVAAAANITALTNPTLLANAGLSLMDFNSGSYSRARSPKRSSPRRSHRSRSRSRSRSTSIGRIEDLDYEEYLRQASKGISIFPGPSGEHDSLYEKKVEAFLRGIRQRSRSNSNSRSRRSSSGERRHRRSRSRERRGTHRREDYDNYRPTRSSTHRH